MKKRKNNTQEAQPQPERMTSATYRVTEVLEREVMITAQEGSDTADVYKRDFVTVRDLFRILAEYVRKDMAYTHERSENGAWLRRVLMACERWNVREPVLEKV